MIHLNIQIECEKNNLKVMRQRIDNKSNKEEEAVLDLLVNTVQMMCEHIARNKEINQAAKIIEVPVSIKRNGDA